MIDDLDPVPLTEDAQLRTRMDCVALGLAARQAALLHGWPARDAAELELVVLELAGNAVRHGGGGQARLAVVPSQAHLEVEDHGPGLPPDVMAGVPRAPGVLPRPGGLGAGLDCVRRLADRLELENLSPGGLRARAIRFPRTVRRSPAYE